MSTLTNNRINTVLAGADVTAMKAALTTLETTFTTYSRPLTVDERKSLPKIQSNNKTFTEDALTAVQNNPQMFPSYFNVTDLQADLTLYAQLEEFVQRIGQLLENFNDTQMLAGSEAYVAALSAYRMIGAAAKAGQPGADTIYNLLKERFTGQGGGGEEETPPTP